jgi:O-antigen ligase
MNTIETADELGDTGYQRLYLWGIAWKLFLDSPVVGVGPENFEYTGDKYESQEQEDRGVHIWGKACHSLFFTLLSEEGLAGVVVFLLIMVTALKDRRQIRRFYNQHRGSLSTDAQEELRTLYFLSLAIDISLVGFLVTGAFITVLYYPHFWLLTAFSVVLKRQLNAILADQNLEDPSVKARRVYLHPVPTV